MADPPSDLDSRLASLYRAYADGLAAKVDAVRTAARPLVEGTADASAPTDAARTLRALAHKLAGSAPTFGFAAVGTAAAEIEGLCDRLIDAGRLPEAGERERLGKLVDALGHASAARS